jgi:hypothetical protein
MAHFNNLRALAVCRASQMFQLLTRKYGKYRVGPGCAATQSDPVLERARELARAALAK